MRNIARSVIGMFEFAVGPVHLKPERVLDGGASMDVTAPLRLDWEIRSKVLSMLGKVAIERAERIVLFVDELDRCRPSYAIRLLEAIKFLFDHEKLTVVFSVDFPMLAQAVRGCYGPGFDGEAYLSRFYDMRFRLPEVDYEHQLMMAGYQLRGSTVLWDTVRTVIETQNMGLRDQLKYTGLLEGYSASGAANEGVADSGVVFVRNVLGPLLLYCHVSRPALLDEFLACDAKGFEGFWREFEGVKPFAERIQGYCELARSFGFEGFGTPGAVFSGYVCPELFDVERANGKQTALVTERMPVARDFERMLCVLHLR